ncbi:MAG: hypothetical protein RLY31_961 [Bacteroidota bacterium]|jgi:hypothetical protein
MTAICDGGSSKADWALLETNGNIRFLTGPGFNPNYEDESAIREKLRDSLFRQLPFSSLPLSVLYYGAGCQDPESRRKVREAFRSLAPGADIRIDTDIMGAARAVCGHTPGIVCILGTGSNSAAYDGQAISDQVENLGFLLGDEGSGNHIGKELVRAFFYREMPESLRPLMEEAFPRGRQDLIERIYLDRQLPAAYLASFFQRFHPHRQHPFVEALIRSCFLAFLERHVCKYRDHLSVPIHFIGSVAYLCQDILADTLRDKGLRMGSILRHPLDGLVTFHQTTG